VLPAFAKATAGKSNGLMNRWSASCALKSLYHFMALSLHHFITSSKRARRYSKLHFLRGYFEGLKRIKSSKKEQAWRINSQACSGLQFTCKEGKGF